MLGRHQLKEIEDYRRSLKSASVCVFDKCGHRPEVEKSADFLREVDKFLA